MDSFHYNRPMIPTLAASAARPLNHTASDCAPLMPIPGEQMPGHAACQLLTRRHGSSSKVWSILQTSALEG
jgi:hypothetical protein